MHTKELLAIFALSLLFAAGAVNARIVHQANAPISIPSQKLLDQRNAPQVLGITSDAAAKAWMQVYF